MKELVYTVTKIYFSWKIVSNDKLDNFIFYGAIRAELQDRRQKEIFILKNSTIEEALEKAIKEYHRIYTDNPLNV